MEAEMEAEQAVVSFQIVSELDSLIPTKEEAVVAARIEHEDPHQATMTNSKRDKKVEWDQFGATTSLSRDQQNVSKQDHRCSFVPPQQVMTVEYVAERSYGQEIVGALRQVVNSPKIEYLRFNGDPLKYVTFIHNFETCLERDNPDPERKLQLLIQHCTGKARESIESCVNLSDGYEVAKETLKENFGKPHIIAEAHVRKLVNLLELKTADGPSLLELARHLTTAERTLTGMGTEYLADLNHMNTLRELVKKLPMFLRAKWTEQAGRTIEAGHRPTFTDLVKFIKDRAKLVDNEFGNDMSKGGSKFRASKDYKGKDSK